MNENLSIDIAPMDEKYFDEIVDIINDGFGSKRCCFCFPGTKTAAEFRSLHRSKPRKKDLAFVALSGDEVLGYVQMSKYGIPAFWDLHDPKPNEVHIDQMAVASNARGKGVGSKLLQHCESFAQSEDGVEILTLDVLKGNAKAISLYKKNGFVVKPPKSPLDECCTSCFSFILMGMPFGKWGVHTMVKQV